LLKRRDWEGKTVEIIHKHWSINKASQDHGFKHLEEGALDYQSLTEVESNGDHVFSS